jgi:hypothetical protein
MAANVVIAPPSIDVATRAFMRRLHAEDWEVIAGHDPRLRGDGRYVSV